MRAFHLSFFLFSIAFLGCSNVPDGFPKVVPCTATITDNGQPVSGASVLVNTVPPTSGLTVSGDSDEQGKVVFTTIFSGHSVPGVPVGNLVMTIFKEPHVPDWKSAEEIEQMGYNEAMAYSAEKSARRARLPRIVPTALNNPSTSPVTIEAVDKKPLDWQVKLEDYRK